jgi:hypothetical protein
MPDLSTTLLVLLAVMAGTTAIRLLSRLRRRLSGEDASSSFSDFLIEDRVVEYRGFVWLALPPFIGGMLLAFWPGANGGSAGAARFFAAFLSVWPVYRFPVHLLEEYLRPFWPKLRVLFALFVGMSASLAYVGFIIVDRMLPAHGVLSRASVWKQFLDGLVTNAVYGPAKYGLATILVLGGVYFNRERVRIGKQAAELKRVAVPADAGSYQKSRDA